MSQENSHNYQNLLKLTYNQIFLSRIKEIRLRYGIPQNGISTDENIKKWGGMYLPHSMRRGKSFLLGKEVNTLLKDLKRPSSYRVPVTNFVLLNEFGVAPYHTIPVTKYDKELQQVRCFIEIFGNTTLRDIKAIWQTIKKIQGGENFFRRPLPAFQKRQRQYFNLLRDAEIRRLREEEGLSLREIAKKTGVSYQEISKVIKRHKLRIGEKK